MGNPGRQIHSPQHSRVRALAPRRAALLHRLRSGCRRGRHRLRVPAVSRGSRRCPLCRPGGAVGSVLAAGAAMGRLGTGCVASAASRWRERSPVCAPPPCSEGHASRPPLALPRGLMLYPLLLPSFEVVLRVRVGPGTSPRSPVPRALRRCRPQPSVPVVWGGGQPGRCCPFAWVIPDLGTRPNVFNCDTYLSITYFGIGGGQRSGKWDPRSRSYGAVLHALLLMKLFSVQVSTF